MYVHTGNCPSAHTWARRYNLPGTYRYWLLGMRSHSIKWLSHCKITPKTWSNLTCIPSRVQDAHHKRPKPDSSATSMVRLPILLFALPLFRVAIWYLNFLVGCVISCLLSSRISNTLAHSELTVQIFTGAGMVITCRQDRCNYGHVTTLCAGPAMHMARLRWEWLH